MSIVFAKATTVSGGVANCAVNFVEPSSVEQAMIITSSVKRVENLRTRREAEIFVNT